MILSRISSLRELKCPRAQPKSHHWTESILSNASCLCPRCHSHTIIQITHIVTNLPFHIVTPHTCTPCVFPCDWIDALLMNIINIAFESIIPIKCVNITRMLQNNRGNSAPDLAINQINKIDQ